MPTGGLGAISSSPHWLPFDSANSPTVLCGFQAKGKPFNTIVGQFQVPPFGFSRGRSQTYPPGALSRNPLP